MANFLIKPLMEPIKVNYELGGLELVADPIIKVDMYCPLISTRSGFTR